MIMEYKCSILTPGKPDPIPKGNMDKNEALLFFEKYNWQEELKRMDNLPEDEIQYSPSIHFDDLTSKKSIELSIVENKVGDFLFYIFYLCTGQNLKPFI